MSVVALSVLTGAAALTAVCACRSVSSHMQMLVPIDMQRSGPQTKEPAGAVALWGNGTLESTVDLTAGRVAITVSAKGTYWNGEWPKIYIELENQIIAAVSADSDQMQDYTVQAEVPHSGANLLRLRLVNYDAAPGQPLAGRNLTIARIVLEQQR
jgi:hypothetical protein